MAAWCAEVACSQLEVKRPDIRIVLHELHPVGKIKNFAPYIAKIKASGAGTMVNSNWGNDLTLLVKALRQFGLDAKFYTFSTPLDLLKSRMRVNRMPATVRKKLRS